MGSISQWLSFFALFLVSSAGSALACSCQPPSVDEAVHQADAVFMGTIKTVTFAGPSNGGSQGTVVFEVNRVWKGHVTRNFDMPSLVAMTACEGFFRQDLVVGKQLLVFAKRSRVGLNLVCLTNICSLTGPPDRYGNTLQVLGEGWQASID